MEEVLSVFAMEPWWRLHNDPFFEHRHRAFLTLWHFPRGPEIVKFFGCSTNGQTKVVGVTSKIPKRETHGRVIPNLQVVCKSHSSMSPTIGCFFSRPICLFLLHLTPCLQLDLSLHGQMLGKLPGGPKLISLIPWQNRNSSSWFVRILADCEHFEWDHR